MSLVGILLGAIGLWGGGAAYAAPGEASNVQVGRVHIARAYGNFAFIHLKTAPSARGDCSVNSYWHFTLSLDDAAGKNMYAMLLTALASGSLISITGTGNCSEFSSAESISGIGVSDVPE
jgi:hypothetical protein